MIELIEEVKDEITEDNFGTMIYEIRKDLGLSRERLARKADIPAPTIQQVEAGNNPTLRTVRCLLNALEKKIVVRDIK